jgi:ERCC4-type nuclease
MPKPQPKIPVVIDTREQAGHEWAFVDDLFTVERGTLVTGDVSVRGLTDVIAIERKTCGDAVSTVIHQWQRFRRELYRLAAMDHPLLVIEASVRDILEHKYESEAEPLSVLGRLNSVLIDHAIPVIYAGDRVTAEGFVERFLIQCVRKCGGVSDGPV